MDNGFIIMVRNIESGSIIVDTTYDWEEYIFEKPRRLIYCQAVSEMSIVDQKIQTLVNEYITDDDNLNINDKILEIINSVQWIANEHYLTSFKPKVHSE